MHHRYLLGCLGLASVPFASQAGGIRLFDHNALATARGNAFVATANNPAAIFYNPAGLTQLEGHQASLGVYGISLGSDYEGPGGNQYSTKDEFLIVPNFFYSYTSRGESRWAVGLGMYVPYGLSLEWPDNVPFRQQAIEGAIDYLTINPVVAYEVLPGLSVAAGPTLNYSEADLANGIFPTPGNRATFDGDDTSVGFNAGILWQPLEKHSFGAMYRFKTSMDYHGNGEINFGVGNPIISNGSAEFQFPQSVTFGYSFRPTSRWNLEVNLDWTDWDTLNTVVLYQEGLPPTNIPFNWKSSWIYEFGATYFFDGGLRVSGGYIYSETAVPEEFFNPVVPDSNRHIFSIGLGKEWDRWAVEAAYQYTYGPERTIATGGLADGTYEFIAHAFSATLSYRF